MFVSFKTHCEVLVAMELRDWTCMLHLGPVLSVLCVSYKRLEAESISYSLLPLVLHSYLCC